MKRVIFVLQLLVCCLFLGQHTVQATEGASSYYFPGASGTFAVAVAPDPGFMFFNQMLFYNAKASEAVLQGRANLEVRADTFYNYVGGFYTFEKPLLGGRFQIGAAVPVGYVHIKAGIDTALGSRDAYDTNTKLGDSLITPALYWKTGDFHFKLVETVFIPTGDYSTDNLANVGRNYWGFDTSFAMTWLYTKTGTEISVMPGIMFNTKNTKTHYQSGNEFHVDFMVNQFLAKNFAVGFQGYYYSQVSGDSGSGAKLGSFKGESLGIGPALLWMPNLGKGKLSLVAKWLHDVDHRNRMEGDYGQFIVSYKF
jgi:hypothetical protein